MTDPKQYKAPPLPNQQFTTEQQSLVSGAILSNQSVYINPDGITQQTTQTTTVVTGTGTQGPTGPTGPTGEKGDRGERGEQGLPGLDGQPGDTGPTGSTGPTGDGFFDISHPTNTSISHSLNFDNINTVSGSGRKFPVLLDDGSITFDYIRAQDIFTDSEFSFSISNFTISGSSNVNDLIGSGLYSVAGRPFVLSYVLPPGTSVSSASIDSSSDPDGNYPISLLSPFTNGFAIGFVSYPSSSGNKVTFTASATSNSGTSSTKTATITFLNYFYSGLSTNDNLPPTGLTGMTDVTKELRSNNGGDSFTENAGTNEYIYYAYPSKYGESTFTFNGLDGGFRLLHGGATAHTNEAGFTETYFIYRSDNPELGDTTVSVSG